MSFVQELKKTSDTIELQHKLDRKLAEIKRKMKVSAESGYRTFYIQIFKVFTNIWVYDNTVENNVTIYTSDVEFYKRKVLEFLTELGFESKDIKLDRPTVDKNAIVITVNW